MEAKLMLLKFVKMSPKNAIEALMAFSAAHWLSHITAHN
jgi:hypothetical protein